MKGISVVQFQVVPSSDDTDADDCFTQNGVSIVDTRAVGPIAWELSQDSSVPEYILDGVDISGWLEGYKDDSDLWITAVCGVEYTHGYEGDWDTEFTFYGVVNPACWTAEKLGVRP